MREKPTNTPIIHSVYYVWYLLHVSALHCHLQGAFLVPSERCSIEEQSIEYCGWASCILDVVRGAHHVTRHNTQHPQYSTDSSSVEHLSEGTRTLPENGNVMPKHVGATIHNY